MSMFLRRASSLLFGASYIGCVYGALTFPQDPIPERKRAFVVTAGKHALFTGNSYLLYMVKLPSPTLLALNLVNDLATFLCVCPTYYGLLLWPRLQAHYLPRDDTSPVNTLESENQITNQTRVEELLRDKSADELLEALDMGEK
jgi:hypothetical protein